MKNLNEILITISLLGIMLYYLYELTFNVIKIIKYYKTESNKKKNYPLPNTWYWWDKQNKKLVDAIINRQIIILYNNNIYIGVYDKLSDKWSIQVPINEPYEGLRTQNIEVLSNQLNSNMTKIYIL